MTTRPMPACMNCAHRRPFEGELTDAHQCDAFPQGIPDDIWMGRNGHTSPVGGETEGSDGETILFLSEEASMK